MACGCNKVRTYSEAAPLMLGEDDGTPPSYVRTTIALMSLRVGSELWVSGAGSEAMIDNGWLTRL